MKRYKNKNKFWTCAWIIFMITSYAAAQTTLPGNHSLNSLEQIAYPTSTERFIDLRTDANINPLSFFKDYGFALGLGKNDDMKLFKVQGQISGAADCRFMQYYRNVRVEGAEFIIHTNAEGKAFLANGELVKGLSQTTNAMLNTDQAREIAFQHIGASKYLWEISEYENRLKEHNNKPDTSYFPKGELIWTRTNVNDGTKPGNYRLGYTFDVHCFSPLKSFRIVISAVDGTVIRKEDMMHNCETTSNTPNPFYTGVDCHTQWTGSAYRLFNDCQNGFIWVRDWNSTSLTSNPIEITDNGSNSNWTSQTQELGTATLAGLEAARDYYANTFLRPGWDSLDGDILAYVNARFDANSCAYPFVTYSEDNASFNWGTGVCLVGSGCSVAGNTDSYATTDILGHEFAHGVTGTSVSGGLEYSYESGALNESFSDIFGEMVEKYFLGSCDYLHGWDRVDFSGSHIPGRSLSNPNSHNDPDTYGGTHWYTGSGDHGGVHTNSGVQNYMFYLLSEGGSGTNDLGNYFTVGAIGNTAASAIAYKALTGYITTNATYADARAAWVNAAKFLYGNCSNEAWQTARAWYAVGVGANVAQYNETVCGNLAAITYFAVMSENTCTTGVTAVAGVTTNITAGEVTLSPGFTASSGCNFSAYITPCSNAIAKAQGGGNGIAQFAERKESSKNNLLIDISPDVKLSPNPFNNNFNLDINLTEDAQVSVTIYDMMGKEVDRIMQNQAKQKGLVQLQYNNEKLPPNIYMCVIEINGKRYTEKIVKM